MSEGSIWHRANDDMKRGDYGMARRRLISHANTCGYEPKVMARIGRIAYDMKDLDEAGRWWLLSDAKGEEVKRAIEQFVAYRNGDVAQMVKDLPRCAKLKDVTMYSMAVQRRLEELKLTEGVSAAGRSSLLKERRSPNPIFAVPFFGFLIVCLMVGFFTVLSWIMDGPFGGCGRP